MASDASSGTYSAIGEDREPLAARRQRGDLEGVAAGRLRGLRPDDGFPGPVERPRHVQHDGQRSGDPGRNQQPERHPPGAPCQEGGERQQHSDTDPERHHDRHECGRGGEHERQECKCTGAMPEPGGEDAVGEVELVGAGIGSLDPRRTSGQVHEPGQGRKPDERREVTAAEDAWDERRPDVDDHAGDPCTVHREHGREAPRRRSHPRGRARRPTRSAAGPSGTA